MAESVWIGWFGPTQGSSSGGSGPTFPSVAVTGQFYAPVSATIPGYSFTGDTNTGYGASAADTLALFAGGTTPRVTVTASAVTSSVPYVGPAGAAATPAFGITANHVGVFSSGDNLLNLATNNNTDTHEFGTYHWLKSDSSYIAFGASADVSLSRGAANRLDLASGDSLNVVGGGGTYMIGGAAGASGTGTVISSITVVGGIVTAISVA